jgi:hypothetical protein
MGASKRGGKGQSLSITLHGASVEPLPVVERANPYCCDFIFFLGSVTINFGKTNQSLLVQHCGWFVRIDSYPSAEGHVKMNQQLFN